jgi:RHS repeat-associated protein
VAEPDSYDAWGKRRFLNGSDDPTGSIVSQTSRGFTGQEMLASVGLVHLNGRVYDPYIGRMTSADPVVGDPMNGQSWNRYSYVYNNPLALTDPTGYCAVCFGEFFSRVATGISKFLQRNPLAGTVLQIAAVALCQGNVQCAGIVATVSSFVVTGLTTGRLDAALLSAAISAYTAAAFYAVGDITGNFEGVLNPALGGHGPLKFGSDAYLVNVAGHALVGCGMAVASGGQCGAGALSGAAPAAAGPFLSRLDWTGRLVASSALGGLASVAGGGKFANGALTGAFGYLFNAAGTLPKPVGDHDYTAGPNLVCPAALTCSSEEIADQGSRFAVPGQDPTRPVVNDERYLVRDPWTGIPGGYVRTNVSQDGLTITNTTDLWHMFCCGQITRTFFQDDTGAWYAKTTGTGYNIIPGMGPANQWSGPLIFNTLDAQMRANIQLHHSTD